MSEELQQKLRDQLWEVANKLRGNMSASDFMYFTLGFIFYKYLSEKIENYANAALVDDDVTFKQLWAMEVYEEEACLKSDVWSLGISIIEMAEGKNPFAGMTSMRIMNQVVNMPSPSLSSSGWSSDLVDFVNACLVKDVNERSSVEALLKVSVSLRCEV